MNNNTEDMSMKELLENTDKVNYSDILAEINPEFNGKDTDKIIEEIVNSNDTESVEKFVVFMEKYEEDIDDLLGDISDLKEEYQVKIDHAIGEEEEANRRRISHIRDFNNYNHEIEMEMGPFVKDTTISRLKEIENELKIIYRKEELLNGNLSRKATKRKEELELEKEKYLKDRSDFEDLKKEAYFLAKQDEVAIKNAQNKRNELIKELQAKQDEKYSEIADTRKKEFEIAKFTQIISNKMISRKFEIDMEYEETKAKLKEAIDNGSMEQLADLSAKLLEKTNEKIEFDKKLYRTFEIMGIKENIQEIIETKKIEKANEIKAEEASEIEKTPILNSDVLEEEKTFENEESLANNENEEYGKVEDELENISVSEAGPTIELEPTEDIVPEIETLEDEEPALEIETTEPEMEEPALEIETTEPEMEEPALEIETTEPEMEEPALEIETSEPKMEEPALEIETSEPEMEEPALEIETTEPEMEEPALEIETSEPEMEEPKLGIETFANENIISEEPQSTEVLQPVENLGLEDAEEPTLEIETLEEPKKPMPMNSMLNSLQERNPFDFSDDSIEDEDDYEDDDYDDDFVIESSTTGQPIVQEPIKETPVQVSTDLSNRIQKIQEYLNNHDTTLAELFSKSAPSWPQEEELAANYLTKWVNMYVAKNPNNELSVTVYSLMMNVEPDDIRKKFISDGYGNNDFIDSSSDVHETNVPDSDDYYDDHIEVEKTPEIKEEPKKGLFHNLFGKKNKVEADHEIKAVSDANEVQISKASDRWHRFILDDEAYEKWRELQESKQRGM